MNANEIRPRTFDQIVGQADAITKIKAALAATRRQGVAVIIIGPSGSGKTTIAMAAATEHGADQTLNGLIEVDPRTADLAAMENLNELMMYHTPAPPRVVILNEVHEMTKSAKGYMLGLLERIPPNNIIIGTTTELRPFDATLASRWKRIEIQTPTEDEARSIVERVQPMSATDRMRFKFAYANHQGNIRAIINNWEPEENGTDNERNKT